MPLVEIFARKCMAKPIPLSSLQASMCKIWGTTPETTKLILSRVEDWTTSGLQDEDCYVSIRAKGTEQRTREIVLDGMKQVSDAFSTHDLVANVRLETYEGARYFHVPPPMKK
mmetsp:Transcript_8650/g.12760  ORF Transcript_8650/g.12760 Transcript_8650/m.12760 type:complete len:113 (-) Transcript_8650:219-557(-)